ncbi:hypothetical protein RKD46_002410 [Streptomyces pseudovenezuelae]
MPTLAASLAQAVSEERASRPAAARVVYLAVLRMEFTSL